MFDSPNKTFNFLQRAVNSAHVKRVSVAGKPKKNKAGQIQYTSLWNSINGIFLTLKNHPEMSANICFVYNSFSFLLSFVLPCPFSVGTSYEFSRALQINGTGVVVMKNFHNLTSFLTVPRFFRVYPLFAYPNLFTVCLQTRLRVCRSDLSLCVHGICASLLFEESRVEEG